MADRNKFEEMLEKLVNEDRAGAEELFHEIVVEKSREIYEKLLEDDIEVDEKADEEVDEATDEEVDEATDEEVDEATNDKDEKVEEKADEEVDEAKDEEVEENFDLDEFEVEADPMDMDPSADMMGDIEMPDDEGDEEEGEADVDDMADDIADLQDEIEKLKAAFDAEMGGDSMDKDDDEMDDAEGDDGDEEEAPEEGFDLGMQEANDEEVDEASEEEVDETTDDDVEESNTPKSEAEQMREYVEKVTAKMGDNGDNTKSPVAGKNDMGGTSSNLVAGGEADSKGTAGGLEGNSPKEENMGNINVPGGKAGKAMKAMPKGHGAEKKGTGESGADSKSTIGS